MEQYKFVFLLEDAANINHIVVFLLPDGIFLFYVATKLIERIAVLPPESAVTIHYQWPGKPFQLLGGLPASIAIKLIQ